MPRDTSRHAAHAFVATCVAVMRALGRRLAAASSADGVLAIIGQGEDQEQSDR